MTDKEWHQHPMTRFCEALDWELVRSGLVSSISEARRLRYRRGVRKIAECESLRVEDHSGARYASNPLLSMCESKSC